MKFLYKKLKDILFASYKLKYWILILTPILFIILNRRALVHLFFGKMVVGPGEVVYYDLEGFPLGFHKIIIEEICFDGCRRIMVTKIDFLGLLANTFVSLIVTFLIVYIAYILILKFKK